MYAFQLGREYKLSIAEIVALFPTTRIEYVDSCICILDTQNRDEVTKKLQNIGGTIKCIELFSNYTGNVSASISKHAEDFQGKFRYGFSILGDNKNLKGILIETKKTLKDNGISSRFINKDFKNLSSAQIIGENLTLRGTDFTLIISSNNTHYFGKTIWVQDIESYSKRDYGKTRDMEVGMLPPKLAQMMIHISGGSKIYDPFCGLGTVLIESILMGNSEVYGSDISQENIEKTKKNIAFTQENFFNTLKVSGVSVLDAKEILTSPYIKKCDSIITEGYLGQIFQKYSVTEKKLAIEKKELLDIYTNFFEGLKKTKFQGNIVICFPFWDIKGKYFYFSDIYAILEKYTKIVPLLPKLQNIHHTRSGSLLYKRDEQIVGREIFKLKMK